MVFYRKGILYMTIININISMCKKIIETSPRYFISMCFDSLYRHGKNSPSDRREATHCVLFGKKLLYLKQRGVEKFFAFVGSIKKFL